MQMQQQQQETTPEKLTHDLKNVAITTNTLLGLDEEFTFNAFKRKQLEQQNPNFSGTTASDTDLHNSGDGENAAKVVNNSSKSIYISSLEENVAVCGKVMFDINTTKKRNILASARLKIPKSPKTPKTARTTKSPKSSKSPKSPISPKTPRGLRTPRKVNTPKTVRILELSNEKTESSSTRRTRKSCMEPKTPSHVRTQVKKQLSKILVDSDEEDFSADDSDYQPSDSSESAPASSYDSDNLDDDDDDGDSDADCKDRNSLKDTKRLSVPEIPKSSLTTRSRQSNRLKQSVDYIPKSDDYFQSHRSKKICTSNHTLDRLKNPRLGADRLYSLLAEVKLSTEHETSIVHLINEYKSYFTKWLYILNEGFSIAVYGLGSKRPLLQAFHKEFLAEQTVLVVNGFFPSLTIKNILDSIVLEILDMDTCPPNPHEAVDVIETEFQQLPDAHLFLIVHNLDGVMLRNEKAQSVLSRLSKIPNIHLIASIDHINAPLLWDQTKLCNYRFSWWDCTTMLSYTEETSFENSLMVQNSGELALSSLRSVFLSLTSNAKGIYIIIVKYQLKNKGTSNYNGIAFKDLYSRSREAFLVSSDLALRTQLTEFLDHKLVKSKRSADGTEFLVIPIDSNLLQQFLDEQEKK